MRIFVGILGVLAVLAGVVLGLFGALVTGDVDTDGSWKCTSYGDGSTGSITQNCEYDSYSSPPEYDRQRDLGMEAVIGGAALVVGGCAFIGGAVAGAGRTSRATPTHPGQPPVSAGPPTYGAPAS